ncbi:hypothetical protein Sango_1169100 [Sesamum angolense]|uniref:Integrase catalytic domain-containing protein n=1 Tax=Sesamum angolense TaxID=2727404 RepID=A0AAE1WVY8_9LAMI|nr:hypothetical protein Sango_1169100 [Sesamum angolense]
MKIEVANLVTQNKGKGKKGKFGPYEKKIGNMSNESFGNKITCFFCRKLDTKRKIARSIRNGFRRKDLDFSNFDTCVDCIKGKRTNKSNKGAKRSSRGGEYYGRYTKKGQNPGPFVAFLKEEGIIAQYTIPGTPQQNGVAERRNRMLMDMDLETSGSNIPRKEVFEEDQVSSKTLGELTVYPGRYQSNPGIEHWKAANKLMLYLQGTKDLQLIYKHTENLEVKSTKPTITASSTMEAEFVACYEATSQALWLRHFITGLKIVDSSFRPIQIFCDNSAVVFFSKNNKSGSRNKHIDIKYLLVGEKVNKKEIIIQHIRTELMVADPMTKALPANSNKNHVDRMGLVNPM